MTLVIMAKAYAHKGCTKMARVDNGCWEEATVSRQTDHPELGHCYIGMWVCGIGAFNCHFPADAVRPPTEQEQVDLRRNKYGHTFSSHVTKIVDEGEFATAELLSLLPRVDWNKL
jgi:hypothetical protein